MLEKCQTPNCICEVNASIYCDDCTAASGAEIDQPEERCLCGHPACSKANGLEADWFAMDRDGHVGIFMSAGYGEIPVLIQSQRHSNTIAEELLKLPEISDASLFVESHSERWLEELSKYARRGIFCFDWGQYGPYSAVAVPNKMTTDLHLSEQLKTALACVRFNDVCFGDTKTLEPRTYFECT